MPTPDIDLTVYPDECDAFGHLNQAAFLSLFERARWEMFARGPGMDVFTRGSAWPAVRKTTIDYHAPAFPGDVLRFQQALTHHGQTSFTMRQTARRVADDSLIATAEFVFVCIDRQGRPVPVPVEVARFMNARPSSRGEMARLTVNGVNLAVDVRGDGPAILLVHGYPLDRTIWQHQVGALTGWRRIAPDLRGLGLSDAPDLGYSMAQYADDLAALLDALGVGDKGPRNPFVFDVLQAQHAERIVMATSYDRLDFLVTCFPARLGHAYVLMELSSSVPGRPRSLRRIAERSDPRRTSSYARYP